MTKQVQRRRGTDTQHTGFTGAEGEISVNTTNKSVHVHDGSTAGGFEAARADLNNVTTANTASKLSGGTVSSLTVTSADINGGTIDGTTIGGSTAGAGTFTNLTADGTINFTGGTVSDLGSVTTADINGGTIDGVTIGGASAGAITATTITGSGDMNIDSGTLFVDASANAVGIGTSSPSEVLHVNSGTDNDCALFVSTDNIAAITVADNSGSVQIRSRDSGDMTFHIGGDASVAGTSSSEAVRIDSSGNVGIGTSSPSRLLDVYSNSAQSDLAITASTTGQSFLAFANTADSNVGAIAYDHATDHMRFRVNDTERMRIDSSGKLLLGSTTTSFGGIDVTRASIVGGSNGSANSVAMIVDEDSTVETNSTILAVGFSGDSSFSSAYYVNFFDSGGQQGRIQGNGANAITYASGSDERLKSNIRDTASKWDALKKIQVRDFEWTADESDATVTGFVAQELNNIIPDAVGVGGEDVTKDPWVVDYGRTTPVIIKALQEAIARIETLEAEVSALKGA